MNLTFVSNLMRKHVLLPKLSLSCNLDDKIEFDFWSKGPLLGISNL